ncbi:MAG TPA: transglutaminase-like domain-containing protein [Thermoanaerobaculia bacterium]|nr:transglutaminase-like domain-containing protein [Thermoanaerobaculia bacterium]
MSEDLYIHPAEARRQFRALAAREIGPGDLAYGALLIALEEYPQLDQAHYLGELDSLASRVSARIADGEPDIFKLGHLHAVMFDVDHYSGNVLDYYDVKNVFLNEVIDRKMGIPITLSIIFLHTAWKIGLNAVGVGLPGHYIVKVAFELNEIYVDPFRGGATLGIEEIRELVAQTTGGRTQLESEHLRGWSERETLMRVLANLQNIHARQGDQRRAASARERIDILMHQ